MPKDAEVYYQMGMAFLGAQDMRFGVSALRKALELDPKNAKCEANLAGILVSKGLRAEARRRYEHSLSMKADLQIAHKELADILCGEGEYDLAITHYEAALRIQPDFKEAKQNLVFTRTLAGH